MLLISVTEKDGTRRKHSPNLTYAVFQRFGVRGSVEDVSLDAKTCKNRSLLRTSRDHEEAGETVWGNSFEFIVFALRLAMLPGQKNTPPVHGIERLFSKLPSM